MRECSPIRDGHLLKVPFSIFSFFLSGRYTCSRDLQPSKQETGRYLSLEGMRISFSEVQSQNVCSPSKTETWS